MLHINDYHQALPGLRPKDLQRYHGVFPSEYEHVTGPTLRQNKRPMRGSNSQPWDGEIG